MLATSALSGQSRCTNKVDEWPPKRLIDKMKHLYSISVLPTASQNLENGLPLRPAVLVSKQPNAQTCVRRVLKVIWCLWVESPKRVSCTVQTLFRTGGNSLKEGFAPCRRLVLGLSLWRSEDTFTCFSGLDNGETIFSARH